jgi:hypothetical protein
MSNQQSVRLFSGLKFGKNNCFFNCVCQELKNIPTMRNLIDERANELAEMEYVGVTTKLSSLFRDMDTSPGCQTVDSVRAEITDQTSMFGGEGQECYSVSLMCFSFLIRNEWESKKVNFSQNAQLFAIHF